MFSPPRKLTLATAAFFSRLAPPSRTREPPQDLAWPDSFTARLAAAALLQKLNAELLSNASATLTLDRWCSDHGLAPDGTSIVAERVADVEKRPEPAVRAALGLEPEERVRYRCVRLRCGDRVFSQADNWYRPGFLTRDMEERLDTTDTSFGRVVQPLRFVRHTLAARTLWHPLPEGWEMGAELPAPGNAPLVMPPFVLEHRAILALPDGRPFSALVETYTSDVLAFPWVPGR